jgi:hypothetical protein
LVALPKRVTPPGPLLGISLVIAPLLTGTVTHALGARWSERAKNPPHGFTFVAGASFAFMMSLTRFSYIVLHWPLG